MEEIEFKKIFKIIFNKKWYIAIIILLSLLVGGFYSFYMITPKYKSSTSILLVKTEENETALQSAVTQTDITLNQKLVSTYSQIIKSKKVLKSVIDNLQLDIKEDILSKDITVAAVSNTELIKVSVLNENPELAATIANEITNVFSKEVKEIYNINNVNVIDKAEPSFNPANINHVKNLAIGLLVGCILSGLLVLATYILDTTIETEEDVENFIGLSVLSSIPFYAKSIQKQNGKINREQNKYKELVVYEDATSPISEFYRTLRANILFTKPDTKIKTILVTSSMQSEGKTWVSSNLAVAYAQSNKRILIIDADMRKGRLHHVFSITNRKGLSNCLSEMVEKETANAQFVSEYIQETGIPNLHIISGGKRPPNPAELVSSNKMKQLLEILKSMYDIIILDGTPSLMVSDSIVLSNVVDTTVIVTESKKSKIENTKKLKKSIENAGGNIAGIVINKVRISAKAYKDRYYYSDKHKEEEHEIIEENNNKSVKELVELVSLSNDDLKEEQVSNIVNDDTIKENLSNAYIENYYESDNKILENKIEFLSKNLEMLKISMDDISNKLVAQKDENHATIIDYINGIKNDIEENKILNTEIKESFQQYNLEQKEELNETIHKITENNSIEIEKVGKIYETITNKQEENEKNIQNLDNHLTEIKNNIEEYNVLNTEIMTNFKQYHIEQNEELNEKLREFQENNSIEIEKVSQMYETIIMKQEENEKNIEKLNQHLVQIEESKSSNENDENLANKVENLSEEFKSFLEQYKENISNSKQDINFEKIENIINEKLEKIKQEYEIMNNNIINEQNKLEKLYQKLEEERKLQNNKLEEYNKKIEEKVSNELKVKSENIIKNIEYKPENIIEIPAKKEYKGWFGKKQKEFNVQDEIKFEDLETTASYICQILNIEQAS